ncbi:MAG TPA: helix-turn-helix transcriptional regulator [Longimicrobium sp.]|nr:helix-turn-helix transcriptional regulator [Longimicrobium sp.]
MNWDELWVEIEDENPTPPEVAAEVDPPYILALNVMRLRRERGITQAQLAEAIGVSQPRIAEVEAGDANPRLVTLSKIAHALGVTLSELLFDHMNEDRTARRQAARERMAAAVEAPKQNDQPRKRAAK